MRRSAAPVRRQSRRNLGYWHAVNRRLYHHLAGKLHSRRLQIERENGVTTKAAQATVKVLAGTSKKDAPDRRQDGVAEITMQRRHRAWRYPASEAVAHYQRIALAQFLEKRL